MRRINEKSEIRKTVTIEIHHYHCSPATTSNCKLKSSAVEFSSPVLSLDSVATRPVELTGIDVAEVDGDIENVEMPGSTHYIRHVRRCLEQLSSIDEIPPHVNYGTKPASVS
jgi:hypothetical protein